MEKEMIKSKKKRKIINILIISFAILIPSFYIFKFCSDFDSIANPDLLYFEIENKLVGDKIYITLKDRGPIGSDELYIISSYKKEDKNNYYNYLTDYSFFGWGTLSSYAVVDSCVVFFVGKKSRVPKYFNSKIRILQFVGDEYIEYYKHYFKGIEIIDIDAKFRMLRNKKKEKSK